MKSQNNQPNSNFVVQSLFKGKFLEFSLFLSFIFVTTISLIPPVIAQINRPSQDFFNQGREQVEREIQILQESPSATGNPQPTPEPILQVSPTPDYDRQLQPLPSVTPSPTPNQINNSR